MRALCNVLVAVLLLASLEQVHGKVWLNEVFTNPSSSLVDWVELWNDDPANSADISLHWLSDNTLLPKRYQFPASTVIPPYGFHVVTQNEFVFGLSAEKDCVVLSDAAGTSVVDSFCFEGAAVGEVYGRWVPSPGEDKHPRLKFATIGQANAYPVTGPIVMSEIMYNPPVGGSEWIKLTNGGTETLNLFKVDSATQASQTYRLENYNFPYGISMAAGASLYLTPDSAATFRTKYAIPDTVQVIGNFVKSNGTGPNQLDNVGEKLELFAPGSFDGAKFDRWPVDVIRYNSSAPWLPSTAGQGAFLVRKCLRAFADEPLNWYPSDQAACNATCARVDECTDTTCSGAGAGGLCACSYDMTTPAVCASPTTIFPPPTNTTGTTSAVNCRAAEWTPWSPCTEPCGGGLRWSSRAVVMRPKNGGTSCPMPLEKSESCNTQSCNPADCLVSEWTAWSPCNCANSTQRTRTVTREQQDGGGECPHLSEVHTCVADCSTAPSSHPPGPLPPPTSSQSPTGSSQPPSAPTPTGFAPAPPSTTPVTDAAAALPLSLALFVVAFSIIA